MERRCLKLALLEWQDQFWRENIGKFEEKDFQVLKLLLKLVDSSSDPRTLAVACHDLGCFIQHFPAGKGIVTCAHPPNYTHLSCHDRLSASSAPWRKGPKQRHHLACCSKPPGGNEEGARHKGGSSCMATQMLLIAGEQIHPVDFSASHEPNHACHCPRVQLTNSRLDELLRWKDRRFSRHFSF